MSLTLTLYSTLLKIIKLQILILFVFSACAAVIFSVLSGLSFFLGGMITIVPSFLFGRIFLKQTGARAARQAVNAFYFGEAVKLLVTIFLFILIFQWQDLHPVPMFLGFIVAQLVYWATLVKSL